MSDSNITCPHHVWLPLLISLVLTMFFYRGAMAMGERYAEQGGRLTGVLRTAMIEKGFCRSTQECQNLLPGTAAHGDRVRIAYYEVSERNIEALSFLVGIVIRHGLEITSGVPITITAYKESHEEYRKSGFFSSIKPFLAVEVNK